MSRVLLAQDDALCNRIVGDLSKFKKTFAGAKLAFEQLQLGTLTNDIFEYIAQGNANGLRPIYIQSIEDQLTAQGVLNPVLRKIAMDGTHELFNVFLAAAKNFTDTDLTPSPYGVDKDRTAFLSLTDLSYDGNDLFVSEESREAILENYCRIYAATQAELDLYYSGVALGNALSNFMKVANGVGLPYHKQEFMTGKEGYIVTSYLDNFFTCDTSMKFEIIPASIPWAANYKAQRERMQAMYNRLQ